MRLRYGPRQHAHVAELEIPAVETESLTAPRKLEDLDGLERADQSLCARHAEALELLGPIAQANSEPEPAARDYIDESRVLSKLQRMIKRRQQDEGADGDAGRARRDGSRRGHQCGQIAVVGEMMLGEPDGIEAELLGDLCLCERFAVQIAKRQRRARRIAEIELITNFHLAHDSPFSGTFHYRYPMSPARPLARGASVKTRSVLARPNVQTNVQMSTSMQRACAAVATALNARRDRRQQSIPCR